MRSFIGIDLSMSEKLSLEAWRERAFPNLPTHKTRAEVTSKGKTRGQPEQVAQPFGVPTANYHLTLCFTGNITPTEHDNLCTALDDITIEPFEFTLDTTGFWTKPKIIFAAPSFHPPALLSLAHACNKAARSAGISVEKRDYKPHVTLVRKATSTTPLPLLPPHLTVCVKDFHLFESFSDKQGVHYPIRESWSLTSKLSVREQLKRGLVGGQ